MTEGESIEVKVSEEYDSRLSQQLSVLFMGGKHPMVSWKVSDQSVYSFYLWAVEDELAVHYDGKDNLFHQIGANDQEGLQGIEIWSLVEPKTPEEKVRIEQELKSLFQAIRQRVEGFLNPPQDDE